MCVCNSEGSTADLCVSTVEESPGSCSMDTNATALNSGMGHDEAGQYVRKVDILSV